MAYFKKQLYLCGSKYGTKKELFCAIFSAAKALLLMRLALLRFAFGFSMGGEENKKTG